MIPIVMGVHLRTPQTASPPKLVSPTDLVLVRRPEETAVIPVFSGKPTGLAISIEKARRMKYAGKRAGDTLYLFSPGVLPIHLWEEEAQARRSIAKKISPDGTLQVDASSPEGRLVLDSLSEGDAYEGTIAMRVFPGVRLTMKRGEKTTSVELNTPLRPRPKIPMTRPSDAKGRKAAPSRAQAVAQAIRGDYVLDLEGAAMFSPRGRLARHKVAFELIEQLASPYLEAETKDKQTLYNALVSSSVDPRKIPEGGTSYNALTSEVRDEIEYALRHDPKAYGFEDEQDAIKWLAGASVAGTDVRLGVGIETERGGSAVVLTRRRY